MTFRSSLWRFLQSSEWLVEDLEYVVRDISSKYRCMNGALKTENCCRIVLFSIFSYVLIVHKKGIAQKVVTSVGSSRSRSNLISCKLNKRKCSLRSWRDFARECFCFGSEAVNASGEAVGGLVKSRVEFAAREIPCGLRPRGIWRLRRHSPAHESRQLRRLTKMSKADYTVWGYIFQYFGRHGLPSSGCYRD